MTADRTQPGAEARRLLEALRPPLSAPDSPHPTPDRMWAYADGSLDAASCAEVERHLASCSGCLDALETIGQALDGEAEQGEQRETPSATQDDAEESDVRATARWIARQQALFDRLANQLSDPDAEHTLAAATALGEPLVDWLEDRLGLAQGLCPILRDHELAP